MSTLWTGHDVVGGTVSPKSFLGEFEQMVLLAILQQGDAAFALEVRREIERSADRTVSRGAFYTTLERLERKDYLRWTEQTSDDVRRAGPMRHFSVTPAGLIALRESRRAFDELSRGLDGVLGEVR
jgi:PadR family transcriptional regulator